MNEDQNEVEAPSLLVDAAGTPLSPEPTIDDKLAEVRRKLGLQEDAVRQQIAESDEDEVVTPAGPSGGDVDWSEYDLDPKFAHLYRLPTTKLRMGPDGPVWVAIIDDFVALRAPYEIIGRRIAQMVNGPDQWRLQSAVVSGGQMSPAQCKAAGYDRSLAGGVGLVTLQRKLPIILPTPALLKSEQEDKASVAPPKDEELQEAENAALAWIESDEGKAAPVNDGDTPVSTPMSLEEHAEAGHGELPPKERIAEGARQAAVDMLRAIPPVQ